MTLKSMSKQGDGSSFKSTFRLQYPKQLDYSPSIGYILTFLLHDGGMTLYRMQPCWSAIGASSLR